MHQLVQVENALIREYFYYGSFVSTSPIGEKMNCSQCKTDKDASSFLWGGKRGRIKVKLCNDCARDNMALYTNTVMVGRKADEFKDAGD